MIEKNNKKIKVLHLIDMLNDGGAQKIILNYLEDFYNDDTIEMKVLVYSNKTNSNISKIISKKGYNVEYIFEKTNNRYIKKLRKYCSVKSS